MKQGEGRPARGPDFGSVQMIINADQDYPTCEGDLGCMEELAKQMKQRK